jgi:hypothetical protein
MDLPINEYELSVIVEALQRDGRWELRDRLLLVQQLIKEGKPYKKILREEYNLVA